MEITEIRFWNIPEVERILGERTFLNVPEGLLERIKFTEPTNELLYKTAREIADVSPIHVEGCGGYSTAVADIMGHLAKGIEINYKIREDKTFDELLSDMTELVKEKFPGFEILETKRPSKKKEEFFETFTTHKGKFYWGLTVDEGYGELGVGTGSLENCVREGLDCLYANDTEDSDFLWISPLLGDEIGIKATGIAVYKNKTVNMYSVSKV